jgi:hypothetical protein
VCVVCVWGGGGWGGCVTLPIMDRARVREVQWAGKGSLRDGCVGGRGGGEGGTNICMLWIGPPIVVA